MKKYLFLIFSICSFQITFGQSLSKYETVNYIDKKLVEVVGHYKTNLNRDHTVGDKNYYWEHNVRINGDKIRVTRTRSNHTRESIQSAPYYKGSQTYPCNFYKDVLIQEFNPIHISTIEFLKDPVSGEPIGSMRLNLIANMGQGRNYYSYPKFKGDANTTYWNTCFGLQENKPEILSTRSIFINFLAADPTTFQKLKKAFEHLRTLFKAEDDPFAE
jgi:hypothetical protein